MFDGEIVFAITDEEQINVDLGVEMQPTRIVTRGDVVNLGRKAPKNRWIYEIKYNGLKEYFESLDEMIEEIGE